MGNEVKYAIGKSGIKEILNLIKENMSGGGSLNVSKWELISSSHDIVTKDENNEGTWKIPQTTGISGQRVEISMAFGINVKKSQKVMVTLNINKTSTSSSQPSATYIDGTTKVSFSFPSVSSNKTTSSQNFTLLPGGNTIQINLFMSIVESATITLLSVVDE